VTFDRRGHRRLGAILGGGVVDLPDLVGHPAFPTTLEALVSRNGGTVLDAAREALTRGEAERFVVPDAVLLPPLFPGSLRSDDADDGVRALVGSGAEVGWPRGAGWLEYRPKIAAIVRRPVRAVAASEVADAIFGYTLVSDWIARHANGTPDGAAVPLPIAVGPCVVTADELDPSALSLTVRVDGEVRLHGSLNGTSGHLAAAIVHASKVQALEAGEAFAAGPFADGPHDYDRQLWPGALVELQADGIGTLSTRLSRAVAA
jgi:2-keto-4-pentenoate hydratase/2-oxohepta-3-ene-1,7-dioic acid hydratase in catechol pathway